MDMKSADERVVSSNAGVVEAKAKGREAKTFAAGAVAGVPHLSVSLASVDCVYQDCSPGERAWCLRELVVGRALTPLPCSALLQPFDVVKTRLQMQAVGSTAPRHANVSSACPADKEPGEWCLLRSLSRGMRAYARSGMAWDLLACESAAALVRVTKHMSVFFSRCCCTCQVSIFLRSAKRKRCLRSGGLATRNRSLCTLVCGRLPWARRRAPPRLLCFVQSRW